MGFLFDTCIWSLIGGIGLGKATGITKLILVLLILHKLHSAATLVVEMSYHS